MDKTKNQKMIKGTVEGIIFQNDDNGYIVFTLVADENELHKDKEEFEIIFDEMICVGYVPKLNPGENIVAYGQITQHQIYGDQFQIENYQKSLPTSTEAIEKYLGSGLIKGIGKALAKRIVAKFGEETLNVIEHDHKKLSHIKGVSLAMANSINETFCEQFEFRNIILFLQKYNVSIPLGTKIYKRYKNETMDVIMNNPFRIAEDIFGVGFKTADSIAESIGIPKDSVFRIKAGIKYVLTTASTNGHVYLPRDILIAHTKDLLNIKDDSVNDSLDALAIENEIKTEKLDNLNNSEVVYLNYLYFAENYAAKKLIELSSNYAEKSDDIKRHIEALEIENDIELADEQKQAVIEALQSGVLVITGGPGTGKTTTINTLIGVLKKENYDFVLAAPTGRAAKRMTETTGEEAQTIHRLLGMKFLSDNDSRQSFEKNDEDPIEADVIIIDESSMIDISLLYHLLKAVEIGTKLILVGDVDQLPSVGPGNVLQDIIESNCVQVVRLNKIFRQAMESAIVMNAHKINKGELPELNDKTKDFFFMEKSSQENVMNTIVDLVVRRLPKYKNCDSKKNIQVLSPTKKSPIGVENLNMLLQSQINPPSDYKKERTVGSKTFRAGDKVMQLKNNYNATWELKSSNGKRLDVGVGIFNGDEGYIVDIDEKEKALQVCFDDNKYVNYNFNQLDELDLAYATTVHKSQGNEYKIVVIVIHSGPPMLFSRNLLYTAVTRAKELCVIVGRKEMLYSMINNKREKERYSTLSSRLIELKEIFD